MPARPSASHARLPFDRLGGSRYRRRGLRDVLAFHQRTRADQRRKLDDISNEAYRDALYDVDADAHRGALVEKGTS